MELTKDLLRDVEHVLREDLNAVIIYALSAIHEVVWLDIGEFVCQALAIEILLLLTRGVSVISEGHDDALEAIILASCHTWLVLLGATVEAKLILLVNEGAKVLIQVGERSGIERLLVCHF